MKSKLGIEYGIKIFKKTRNGNLVIWDQYLSTNMNGICESLKLWNFETLKLRNFETKKPRSQETFSSEGIPTTPQHTLPKVSPPKCNKSPTTLIVSLPTCNKRFSEFDVHV